MSSSAQVGGSTPADSKEKKGFGKFLSRAKTVLRRGEGSSSSKRQSQVLSGSSAKPTAATTTTTTSKTETTKKPYVYLFSSSGRVFYCFATCG